MKILYMLIMAIAGAAIPVMAALNASLAAHLKSLTSAVWVFFGVSFLIASLLLLVFGGGPSLVLTGIKRGMPIIYLLGGLGVVFYIISASFVGPRFGMGNTIACVLMGQLLSMLVIDHFGLLGMPQEAVSINRLAGVGLMSVGLSVLLLGKTSR